MAGSILTHTHFVGIGGAGMSSLAAILLQVGEAVSGCDLAPGPSTLPLAARGVRIETGHSPEHLEGVDRLVVTGPAMGCEEVTRARELGLPVLKRAELLGTLMNERRGIAVAGTHGKTTTTSLLAAMLIESGLDPTVLVGGVPAGWESGGRYGRGEWMVAEADEYDRSFLHLHPEVAIVTGIEMDHPDIYSDLEEVKDAFGSFLGGMHQGGIAFVRAASPTALHVARQVAGRQGLSIQTYGAVQDADWSPVVLHRTEGYTHFEVRHREVVIPDLRTALPGDYNLDHATAAAAVAHTAGASDEGIRAALAHFHGVGRRWETKGEARGVLVVDDYGHHPAAVEAMLRNARERYPDRKLWVVFQPHTYSRTRQLLHEFAQALRLADRAYVLDVYAAREQPDPEVSAERLAGLVDGAIYAGDVSQASRRIAADIGPGVLLVTMGAGDVTNLGPNVLELLRAGEAR